MLDVQKAFFKSAGNGKADKRWRLQPVREAGNARLFSPASRQKPGRLAKLGRINHDVCLGEIFNLSERKEKFLWEDNG